LFDLGMVLAEPVGLYEGIAALLGTDPAAVERVFWIHRRAYDLGLADHAYWTETLADLELTVDLDVLLPELVTFDMGAWSQPRPAAAAILSDLGARDIAVAVLSNAPASFAAAARRFPWRHLAQRWFFSAELGLAKPDPAIYAHVEHELAVSPDQLWFVDDRPENVAAATRRGWHAHLWSDDTDTRAWLVESGLM
jgi:putative hydrolase of the HAD superfamily